MSSDFIGRRSYIAIVGIVVSAPRIVVECAGAFIYKLFCGFIVVGFIDCHARIGLFGMSVGGGFMFGHCVCDYMFL